MNGILFTLGILILVIVCDLWGFTTIQITSLIVTGVSLLHFLTSVPGNLAWKATLYLVGTVQFVVSSEKKGMSKGIPNPDKLLKCEDIKKKRIIFIRHGESVWNEMFNKGFLPPGFPFRVVRGVVRELFLLTSRDSVFYDSPLSSEGETQAKDLASFLSSESNSKDKFIRILNGEEGSSVVVSSCLRRALSTVFIGLYGRFEKYGGKVLSMSVLQEMSRNVDTVAVSPARKLARLPVCERRYGADGYVPFFDSASHEGNKSPFRRAYKDMLAFNEWVFKRNEDTIIVGGHSLWFKQYYRCFLPRDSDHESKKYKMVNAGAIGFELSYGQTKDGAVYRIDPSSMTTIYGGYKRK
eukprot:g6201.t1